MEIVSFALSLVALAFSAGAFFIVRKKEKADYKAGVYHFDDNHEARAVGRKDG